MKNSEFTNWIKWENRDSLTGIKSPGVYCIAISEKVLSAQSFSWIREIAYVGMTNAQNGLKGRLKQFDNTIKGKTGHGGAARVRFKHDNYSKLVAKLYVSVRSFDCDVKTNSAVDLRTMGDVAKFEYDCFAEYVEKYDKLPEFNDKKRSPKK